MALYEPADFVIGRSLLNLNVSHANSDLADADSGFP